jgi:type VI secretion system Hcp family effector
MNYLGFLLLVAGMTAFHPAADNKTFVSFKGSRQGQFKGTGNSKGGRESEGWFAVNAYSLGVETPKDPSNTRTAKQQHNPVTIRKGPDASSPKLLEALNTREKLEVVIQVLDANNKIVRNIILKNAIVKGIHKDDWENVTIEFTDIVIQP